MSGYLSVKIALSYTGTLFVCLLGNEDAVLFSLNAYFHFQASLPLICRWHSQHANIFKLNSMDFLDKTLRFSSFSFLDVFREGTDLFIKLSFRSWITLAYLASLEF